MNPSIRLWHKGFSMKRCGDCGQTKPVSGYHSNVRCPDGLAFYCKPCAAARSEQSRRRRGIRPRRSSLQALPPGMKWCPDCDAVKELDDFPRNKNTRTGRAPYCKACHNVRGQMSKIRAGGSRTYHLKRRYGITAAEADVMLAAQDGLCAICRVAPAAHVDHDHATAKVRALLCFNCNGGLGQFKDRIEVLEAAVGYLKDHGAHAEAEGERASASPQERWPRVIELFPYRGGPIAVAGCKHRRSA